MVAGMAAVEAASVAADSTEVDLLEVIAAEHLVARTEVDRRSRRLAG